MYGSALDCTTDLSINQVVLSGKYLHTQTPPIITTQLQGLSPLNIPSCSCSSPTPTLSPSIGKRSLYNKETAQPLFKVVWLLFKDVDGCSVWGSPGVICWAGFPLGTG